MVVGIAEQGADHGQPLEVVADEQLVGHAHAAVQLDRLLAEGAGRAGAQSEAKVLEMKRRMGFLPS